MSAVNPVLNSVLNEKSVVNGKSFAGFSARSPQQGAPVAATVS